MPGSETIKLDPSAVATNRTELDITKFVAVEGVDWGNAEIQQFMADGAYGSVPVDYRIPSRTVTMPLRLQTRGTETLHTIRNKLQSKVALFQAEGGWLGRVTSSGGTVFADVTNATLKLGGGWGQAHGRFDEGGELTLECVPDWYEGEVTASTTHDESTLPELVWTETAIQGNYPGRVRLVVTERQGQDQLGLLWGFRCRHYSSASTARLAYEAEALTPMDTAAVAVLSGASGAGSNTMQHSNLGTNWTPVLNTNLLAGTYLTHTGSYRVWARVYSTSPSSTVDVDLRFVWDVGDMTNPTENAPWTFPGASNFYMADLGEIRLDPTTGTHRWQGQIQARGDVGGESCRIDRLFFQPLDEGAGRLIASANTSQGLVAYSLRDEFNQTAGNLTGKTLPAGGTWTAVGDTDDFTVETTGKTAQRTAVSDTGGMRIVYGSTPTLTSSFMQVDFTYSTSSSGAWGIDQGVAMRVTDLNNHVRFFLETTNNAGTNQQTCILGAIKRVGGSDTILNFANVSTVRAGQWMTVRAVVDTAGRWWIWLFPKGGSPSAPFVAGVDSALATGGALASGKIGILDGNFTGLAVTRNYDNPQGGVPALDAVVYANRSVELASDGMRRSDSAGSAYGPVSEVTGDHPRVPVAGLESRTTELFVKSSRGDFDQLPDSAIDDIRGQANYRPAWLQLPDDTGS